MKSNHFVYNFKAQLAAKCCCGTKSKRDTQQPVALLSTVGNVVLEINAQGSWRAGLNWSACRMRPEGRSLATPALM